MVSSCSWPSRDAQASPMSSSKSESWPCGNSSTASRRFEQSGLRRARCHQPLHQDHQEADRALLVLDGLVVAVTNIVGDRLVERAARCRSLPHSPPPTGCNRGLKSGLPSASIARRFSVRITKGATRAWLTESSSGKAADQETTSAGGSRPTCPDGGSRKAEADTAPPVARASPSR